MNEKKKVLIVDDEQDILFVLAQRFKQEGFDVVQTTKGQDVLELARSQNPNLIILDIILPDIDGGHIAGELKKDSETKRIPVVFLSALCPKDHDKQGHVIGGNLMFSKPYDIDELITTAHELTQ